MAKHITKHISLLIVGLLCSVTSFSLVTVTGAHPLTDASSPYANLATAFTAINAQAQVGRTITVTVTGICNQGAVSAILNAQAWTSLTIMPDVGGGTISGSPANPLIDLNGADNVTIDGRVGGVGAIALTITNTNTNFFPANLSTIRFINDATSNTIKYCVIKGGARTFSTSGTILFDTGVAGGNSGNIIQNCIVTNTNGNRPLCSIYSSGSVGNGNNNNQILNNDFSDFLHSGDFGGSSYGVYLKSNSSGWVLKGNNFYETSGLLIPTQKVDYKIISLDDTNGSGYEINGNNIGGSGKNSVGTWTKTNANDNNLTIISLKSNSAGATSKIINNTIKGLVINNQKDGYFKTIDVISGNVNIGVDGGTPCGNIIGSRTGTGSIQLNDNGNGNFNNNIFYGININSTGTIDCQNNILGSISTNNANATNQTSIYLINRTSAGTSVFQKNIIGGDTPNSVNAAGTSTSDQQDVFGLRINTGGTNTLFVDTIQNLTNSSTNLTTGTTTGIFVQDGTTTIDSCTVHDLSSSTVNKSLPSYYSINGIAISKTFTCNLTSFSKNKIYNLKYTNSNFAGNVVGAYFKATNCNKFDKNEIYNLSAPNLVSGSNALLFGLYIESDLKTNVNSTFIHDFSVNIGSTGASFYGIYFTGSTNTFTNNIISLMPNTATTLYGMYDLGDNTKTNNLYFNTIYLGGNCPAPYLNKSYCINSTPASNSNNDYDTRDFRNNILHNVRISNFVPIPSSHYAIYVDVAPIATSMPLTSEYNDYYVNNGTGGVLGYFGADEVNLDAWQNATKQDFASVSVDPGFPATTLPITVYADYVPTANKSLAGIAAGGVVKDFNDINNRPKSVANVVPTMGAIEIILDLPVKVFSTNFPQPGNVPLGIYPTLGDAFLNFNNGTHKTGPLCPDGIFDIRISSRTAEPVSAVLYQSGFGGVSAYNSIHVFPTASGHNVGGNLAGPLVSLDGADKVTIDGRVNGVGTTQDLIFINRNNATNASTFEFQNGACSNTIEYAIIKNAGGYNLGTNINTGKMGAVVFLGTTDVVGNNNNKIINNILTNAGSSGRPSSAIYSSGQGTGLENIGNTINNNNFKDVLNYWGTSGATNIFIHDYNLDWNIQSNHFYETQMITASAGFDSGLYPILIGHIDVDAAHSQETCIGTSNIRIINNYIGGSAPNCAGLPYTLLPSENLRFGAINVGVESANTATIQGNIIKNFDWKLTGHFMSVPWTGIYISDGTINIGDSVPNIIGDSVGNNSIYVRPASYSASPPNGAQQNIGIVYGIYLAGSGSLTCNNNVIGSINVDAENNITYASQFTGISCSNSGISNIKGNLIGSKTTLNSINSLSTSTVTSQDFNGIYINGGTNTVTQNTIANLKNSTTKTNGGKINGICIGGGTNTITGNIVHDLSIANGNTATDGSASVIGIASTGGTNTITGDTIYNLKNTNATFAGSVYGVYSGASGASISANLVYGLATPNNAGANAATLAGYCLDEGNSNKCSFFRNFTYNYSVNATNTGSNLYGVMMRSGVNKVYNNIVYLGGSTVSNAVNVYGIYENGANTNNNDSTLHNTIYLGGTAAGAVSSYCYYSPTVGAGNKRVILNNVFYNDRTGGTANYAAYFATTNSTNIKLNFNDYRCTSGSLGYFNGISKNPPIATNPIIPGNDTGSKDSIPLFRQKASTVATDYQFCTLLKGTPMFSSVPSDFGAKAVRSKVSPMMGAWEYGPPDKPDTIKGPTRVCPDSAGLVYRVSAVQNAEKYHWEFPTGWKVTTPNTLTNTATVNDPDTTIIVTSGSNSGYVKVWAENLCGPGPKDSIKLDISGLNTVGVASSSPTICINDLMTPLTHNTTNATGIANDNDASGVNGLPAGVKAQFGGNATAGTITISGTPSVSGTFNYKIPLTGGCGADTAKGKIIVDTIQTASVTVSSSATPVCKGDTVTFTATPKNGGTAPIFQWYVNGIPMGKDSIGFKYVPSDMDQVKVIMTSNATPCLSGSPATSNTLTIAVAPNPTTIISAGNLTPICFATGEVYSVVATPGSTYKWTLPVGAVIASASPDSSRITVDFLDNSGKITVVETSVSGCVGAALTWDISLLSCTLKANFDFDKSSYCLNEDVTFTNKSKNTTGATTYLWDFGIGATPATANTAIPPTVKYSSVGTKNVKLTIIDGISSIKDSINCIVIKPDYTITLDAGVDANPKVCINQPITPITCSTTDANGATFAGLPAGVSGNWKTNKINISGAPSTSGTYPYVVKLTGGCGNDSIKGTIIVDAASIGGSVSGGVVVCANTPNSTTLKLSGQNGTIIKWQYSTDLGNTWKDTLVTKDSITINNVKTTTQFRAEVINGVCAPVYSTSSAITVSPIPITVKSAGNLTPNCSAPGEVYSVVATPGSKYNWVSKPADATIVAASSDSSSITVNFGKQDGKLSVIETNADGCKGLPVEWNVSLVGCGLLADFTTDTTSYCFSDTVVFTDASKKTSINTTYLWDFGLGATPATATTPGPHKVTYSVSGSKTVSLIIKEGITSKKDSVNCVIVNANNSIKLSSKLGSDNQLPICETSQIDTIKYLTSGATGATVSGLPAGVTYSWVSNVLTISGTPTVSGTFSYIVTLIGGCGNVTASGTITMIKTAAPTLVSNPVFCISDGATVNSLNSFVVEKSIKWYDAPSAGNQLSANDILKTGTYYATQTINGCESINRLPVAVTVYPNPVIVSQPLTTQTVYVGDPVRTLTVSYSSGSGTASYKWYSNKKNNNTTGDSIKGETNQSFTPSSASPGTFYYYCEVTMSDGRCSVVSNVSELIVMPNGIIVTADTINLKCPHDDNGQITLHITGGNPYTVGRTPYNITWKGPNGEVIIDGAAKVSRASKMMRVGSLIVYDRTLSNLKAGVYEVTVSDAIPTVVTKQFTIIEPAEISIKATIKKSNVAKKQRGEIFAEVTGGTPPYHLTWTSKNDTLPDISLRITNLGPGVYELTVTDANGCTAGPAKFKIDEDLGINTFSPNGDGVNDLFMENLFLQVFNRNGILLYEGTSGWDGTFNNQPMQDDTYMYVVKYKSDTEYEYKTGYVTLVR